MDTPPIPIGAGVWVSDVFSNGPAIVLEYDPDFTPGDIRPGEASGPYYCHLLDNCDHELWEGDDGCIGEGCRGWYQITPEAS